MSTDPLSPTLRRPRAAAWNLPWSGALVTVLLAGLAAFLGARLGTDQGRPGSVPLGDRVFELIGDEHSITAQQREAISRIGARYAPLREQLRAQSRAANIDVVKKMAEEQRFGPHTEAALAQLQQVMGERLKLSMEYMLEVRGLLTPPQQELFDRRVAEEAAVSR
jgi:Spy/CpxP family protein refolding chaperone